MSGSDLQDALHTRIAGSTEGMTLQVLAQIRDSLSAQNRDMKAFSSDMRAVVESVSDVRERVIRLEERDRRLADVESDLKVLDAKVAALMKDKDQRDGAVGMLGLLRIWGPVLFSALAALWLFGRSAGIVPAPPVDPVRVEATGNPRDQRIEGTVGGKP